MNARTLVAAGLLTLSPVLVGCASTSSSTTSSSPVASSAPATTDSSSAPASSAPASSAPASSPAASSPSPSASVVTISAAVANGKVTPATKQYDVPVGSKVHFTVTSDVADEVHLHGYDIEKKVAAGGTVVFDFVADQTGVFEVETHGTNLTLFKLSVS
jgi:cytoskeletal protein RodZ